MRVIILSLCVLSAACSGQAFDSPTSPTGATSSTTGQMQAKGGTQLPFRGSLTTFTDVPPPNAHAFVTGGTATHLGAFTGTLTAVVDLATSTATGTFEFVAANGDRLSGTFIGVEGVFVAPGVARLTEVATIESGTGRFAGATGTFTLVRFDTIDFTDGTATGDGTFEGHINLNK